MKIGIIAILAMFIIMARHIVKDFMFDRRRRIERGEYAKASCDRLPQDIERIEKEIAEMPRFADMVGMCSQCDTEIGMCPQCGDVGAVSLTYITYPDYRDISTARWVQKEAGVQPGQFLSLPEVQVVQVKCKRCEYFFGNALTNN